ncbi:MAG TPA: propionate catabolism operon regulatory protein PrpR [Anaeromyxobacteraceae bacterium]|nr:propionate catabolism operon regulatory protein PrpR [Anaeromyxobacteraceae bacterium]
MPESRRKPTIWAFSVSRLRHVFESVAPLYADAADIRVFDKAFENAVQSANELVRSGEHVDAIIAAGAHGAYLHEHTEIPVVLVVPTATDILHALADARRFSRRIAFLNFRTPLPGLDPFTGAHGLEVEQCAYVTLEDAEASLLDLAARGFEVVVAPGPVCDIAQSIGLRAVLLHARSSACDAIDRAIEVARLTRAARARQERVTAVLDHVEEAIIGVDMEERIHSANRAVERLLGVPAAGLIGRPLSTVSAELSVARVLGSGAEELGAVHRVGGRTLVVNRIPLREHGVQVGAVVTCQDPGAIQRVDRTLRSEHRPRRFVARHVLSGLVGGSRAIGAVRELAEDFARTDATVLVTGESGTGKELLAQGIHNASRRRDHPFVAINCPAFPDTLLEAELFGHEEGAFTGARRGGRAGLFEAAHTGTIFLDEVGDIAYPLQSRLLRVLQERQVLRLGSNDPIPVDVRVIAATNRDLRAAVLAGDFREDLFYRLKVLHLHLPPLRERPEDVPPIAEQLLSRALVRYGAPGALASALAAVLPLLQRYAWPGNVREMENVIERIAVLCAKRGAGAPGEEQLRAFVPELFAQAEPGAPEARRDDGPDLRSARESQEQEVIRRVLDECGGNQTEAARRLRVARSTLWRKLKA